MSDNMRLRRLLFVLFLLGIIRFLWVPAINRIRSQTFELKYSRQMLQNQNQSMDTNKKKIDDVFLDRQSKWESIMKRAYHASTSLEAGMNMVKYIRDNSINKEIEIRSSMFLPTVYVDDDLSVICVEMNLDGSLAAILELVDLLVLGTISHRIENLTLEKTSDKRMSATFSLSALAIINEERTSLPFEHTFKWKLVGIIHQKDKATAILIHKLTGTEAFVQSGDRLNADETILEVGMDFVRISDGYEEIRLVVGL